MDVTHASPIEPKPNSVLAFIRRYNVSLTIVLVGVVLASLYIWVSLPAPYSLGYRIKMMTKDPTFKCKDGTWSWAVTRQGACPNHGGVDLIVSRN